MLATLEKSVVYVTSDTIEPLILNHRWDRSCWDLANMYLLSVGAKLLGKKAARIVGMSEETTCYVSPDYFAEGDPFADFIVHEAAHIFHNCKRRTIGLRETRTKEWLLDIEFRKRETFAYSCEAYARIVARARNPAERRALAAEYGSKRRISAERVDPAEVASIVADAASARNGWKAILARCAPTTKPRSALQLAREMIRQRSSTDHVHVRVPLERRSLLRAADGESRNFGRFATAVCSGPPRNIAASSACPRTRTRRSRARALHVRHPPFVHRSPAVGGPPALRVCRRRLAVPVRRAPQRDPRRHRPRRRAHPARRARLTSPTCRVRAGLRPAVGRARLV